MPKTFTPECPNVAFFSEAYGEDINDHALGKLYPNSTHGVSTQPLETSIRPLLVPTGFPATFNDLATKRWPQLTLFVSTFNDATIVSILWPHTLLDASAFRSLLKNWSHVLAGREDQVEAVYGSSTDPLSVIDADHSSTQEHILDHHRMSWWRIVPFCFRFLRHYFMASNIEKRMIYLPRGSLEKLTARTIGEAQSAAQSSDAFISEGDIVTAWLTRAAVVGNGARRPATIVDVVNLRGRFSFLKESPNVFLQNMLSMAVTVASADETQSSAGYLALLHRRALSQQLEESQLAIIGRRIRHAIQNEGMPPIFFGPSSAIPVVMNNIAKLSYIQAIDFSKAVTRAGDSSPGRLNPPGTPTVAFTEPIDMKNTPGFCFVWGKDHDGGLWLSSAMTRQGWELLERDLASL